MTDNVKVAISSDFLTAFARLPRQVQGKVTEFVNKFRNNPMSPGINYEKLNSGIDKKIFSVRIDDTYRGIVVRQQEVGVYLLLWVDHHDEAYQWAVRKRLKSIRKLVLFRCLMLRPWWKRYLHLIKSLYLLLQRMMNCLNSAYLRFNLILLEVLLVKRIFTKRNNLCHMMLMSIFLG